MRPRQVQLVVLCEDDEHESFIRGLLGKRTYEKPIRVSKCPKGRGSARHRVETQYAAEVRAARRYRAMHDSGSRGLVVLQDADERTHDEVYLRLDELLRQDAQEARKSGEGIAIFVPRWCIETWAYHLLDTGRAVDEATEYSEPKWGLGPRQCNEAGALFHGYEPQPKCPPSLVVGCEERGRIPG